MSNLSSSNMVNALARVCRFGMVGYGRGSVISKGSRSLMGGRRSVSGAVRYLSSGASCGRWVASADSSPALGALATSANDVHPCGEVLFPGVENIKCCGE